MGGEVNMILTYGAQSLHNHYKGVIRVYNRVSMWCYVVCGKGEQLITSLERERLGKEGRENSRQGKL